MPSSYAWIKRIRKGDILRSGSGMLRVVRAVSHHGPSIPKTNVTFSIKRCSWTGRCYTVMTGNDLRQLGYRPTRGRMRLRGKLDLLIEGDFGASPGDTRLTCCDVEGVS